MQGKGITVGLTVMALLGGAEPPVSASASQPSKAAPEAIVANGCTFVALRSLGQWLGAEVNYEPKSRRIGLSGFAVEGKALRMSVYLTVGSREATIRSGGDPTKVALAAAPIERGGVAYVPLRFVADTLGMVVEWSAADQAAVVEDATSGQRRIFAAVARSPGIRPKDGAWEGSHGDNKISLNVQGGGQVVSGVVFTTGPAFPGTSGDQKLQPGPGYEKGAALLVVDGAFSSFLADLAARMFGGSTDLPVPSGVFTSGTTARFRITASQPSDSPYPYQRAKAIPWTWECSAKWVGPARSDVPPPDVLIRVVVESKPR